MRIAIQGFPPGIFTLILVAAFLAGCTSSQSEPDGDEAVTTFTDPNQGRLDPTKGAHLHNYWGSQKELAVLDAQTDVGPVTWNGPIYPVAEFLPESGSVVPQGASMVRVTMTWTDSDPLNLFGGAELWVKTAADNASKRIGPIASGEAIEVQSTNEANDLPHQPLSAWSFDLVLLADTSLAGQEQIIYQGTVAVKVTAVRGLEIPLYPGHPDQWLGRTEITLVNESGAVLFDGDPASGTCRGFYDGCPGRIAPSNGTLVPTNADHVTIQIDRSNGASPLRLGVKYHSAASREFGVSSEVQRTDTRTTYNILVDDGGDGPYAKQSQWAFYLYIAEPSDKVVAYEEYTLKITAYKDP